MSHNKPSRLRFAINLGNAVLAHLGETGKPAGITVELSHRLATRWGVSAEFVPYPAAGKVVADAGGEHWDIAFLAIDPAREATLRFTSPYITIQGTALVSVDSPCQSVADMDRPATTINVGQKRRIRSMANPPSAARQPASPSLFAGGNRRLPRR
ncbi:probable extracellular solute-binding protein [Klebsiella pneumoniae IS43]|uniref:Probable extracellular solute-binding protein n=1 Tax=Klebsiella pneumoniae IS43 TaxID=1432552 RepID=W1DLY2_KLEPN|nr:probable extracellular solute-binding protein [Klebsiella pneumoniae IS43]